MPAARLRSPLVVRRDLDILSLGPSCWLKPETLGDLADGAEVATWPDSSGNKRDFVQGSSSNRPTFQTNEINGLGVARFDGVADIMTGPILNTLITAAAFTAFSVIKPNIINTNSADTYGNDAVWGDAGGYTGLHLKSTLNAFAYNWDNTDDKASVAIATGVPMVIMTRHEAGSIFISRDGGAEASAASGNTVQLSSAVEIGRGFTLYYYDGDLAEQIWFNRALTSNEIAAVFKSLKTKYAIGTTNPFSIPWYVAVWADDPLWAGPADGGQVSSWRDGSDHGRDITQASSSLRPLFRASTPELGGRGSVEFDGVDDLLGVAYTEFPQPYSIIWIGKKQGAGILTNDILVFVNGPT